MQISSFNADSPGTADQPIPNPNPHPQSKQDCLVEERMDIDNCQTDSHEQSIASTLEAQVADLTAKLQEKHRHIQDLQTKFDILNKDVAKKDEDASKFRKLWKKAAMELDKFRANGQGFYQITDEYLLGLINHLRIIIRDLAIQYFDRNPLKNDPFIVDKPNYMKHLERTTPQRKGYFEYIQSSTKSNEIIQAFLWRVIVHEVFGKCTWVGNDASTAFHYLRAKLDPSLHADPQRRALRLDPEAERKFQSWSATTTAMLLDSLDTERVDEHMKRKTAYHVELIGNTVRYLVREDEERGFRDQLLIVIGQAFALDKEIHRQVGRVIWRFDCNQPRDGDHSQNWKDMELVIAPAVFKRGKSTGEGFDQEVRLLSNIVS